MSYSIRVTHIVFSDRDNDVPLDPDEPYYQPFATLHRHDGSVVSYIPTEESVIAAAQMLSQWDYGEDDGEITTITDLLHPGLERYFIRPDREDGWIVYTENWSMSGPPFHNGAEPAVGDYVLTEHQALGYVALDRIVQVTVVTKQLAPLGEGFCPLETAYGHGGPTEYCTNELRPGDAWCVEHLSEWGYRP